MTITVRLILACIIAYLAIMLIVHALRGPSLGAVAGHALWYGFGILLCVAIWRRVGSRHGGETRIKGTNSNSDVRSMR
jgi:membrane protein DedA with SNARE-associated domain